MSSFLVGFLSLHPAGQADYIRVCLLEKYGGVWIDTTTYVTSGNEMEWFFSEAINGKREIVGFICGGLSLSLHFFGASENSSFMKRYKKEFDLSLKVKNHQYIVDSCRELLSYHVIRKEDCQYYLIGLVVFFKSIYDDKSMRDAILYLPANRSNEILARECLYKHECFRDRLLHDPVARAQPFIKLWHEFRNGKRFHIGDTEYELNLKEYVPKVENKPAPNYKPFLLVLCLFLTILLILCCFLIEKRKVMFKQA